LSILRNSSALNALVVAFVKDSHIMFRFVLILGLSLVFFSGVARAEGEYQKTRDGRTTVWNNEPKAGDEATWSGDRDDEGYAKGFGTLSWYSKSALFARYFGNMVRGKFDGPVNVHAKNQTHYAVFVDGTRMTRWIAGAAPTRAWAQHRSLAAAKREKEPAAPAEGPAPKPAAMEIAKAEKPEAAPPPKPVKPPEKAQPPSETLTPPEVVTPDIASKAPEKKETAAAATDGSLQLLTGPPTSLRDNPPAPPADAGQTQPRLTNPEVVDLADGATRSHGLSPAAFERGEPSFNAQDETWSVAYGSRGGDENARGFSVTVDDKTKGTVFVPAK
jgi:hypothetical protein